MFESYEARKAAEKVQRAIDDADYEARQAQEAARRAESRADAAMKAARQRENGIREEMMQTAEEVAELRVEVNSLKAKVKALLVQLGQPGDDPASGVKLRDIPEDAQDAEASAEGEVEL